MKTTKDENQTFKSWLFKNTTWIVGILFLILNIYLTTKLTPLAQGIELNSVAIAQMKENIKNVGYKCENKDEKVWEELKYIRSRVDSIYNNLK